MWSHARISSLLAAIYSAAEDPSKWSQFLSMLAADLGGATPVIVTVDGDSPICNLVAFANLDLEVARLYDEYWGKEDIYAKSGHPLTRTEGATFLSHAVVPLHVARRSPFISEYSIPNGMGQNIAGIVAARPGLWSVLSCNFPVTRPIPSDEQVAFVRLLVPHLTRAIWLHRQLKGRAIDEAAMTEVLDRLPVGFLLVGSDGRTIRMNREAERILAEQDGMGQRGHRVFIRTAGLNQKLQHLIREAARTATGRGLSAGGVLSVPRPSGRRAYSVMVTPVGPEGSLFNQQAAYTVVLISDLERRPVTDIAKLRKLFGLTKAEARVSLAMVEGLRPEDIRDRFHVSQNTLRTHLKRLYDKTGTHGQAGLLRLLLRSPAALWED